MKLSVIIAVYNRAHLLTKALWSLKHQSIAPDELILTDDGSDEDIPAAIQPIVRGLHYPVKFISQPHQGFRLARCRNNGARHATGDYFIFLDQDIVLSRNFLEICVKHRRPRQFCVAYPVRLTGQQSQLVTESVIERSDFRDIVTKDQVRKVKWQYFKDNFYGLLKRLHLRRIGPKLRGLFSAINRDDFILVNGYDENYQGWGNEDDDLGHRLYAAGIRGKNPFYTVYPLHLFHPPYHQDGERVNQAYYARRRKAIDRGDFRCSVGFDQPGNDENLIVLRLN